MPATFADELSRSDRSVQSGLRGHQLIPAGQLRAVHFLCAHVSYDGRAFELRADLTLFSQHIFHR